MKSLRSRLILGSALIAVVPLALAMILLAQRIESTMRVEASARLEAALANLERQIAADAARLNGRMEVLARDPELRRLYLVPGARHELTEYLADRRFLLGLDFVQVLGPDGAIVAAAGDSSALRVEIAGTAPIRYEGAEVGRTRGGTAIDAAFLARLRETTGMDLVLRDRGGAVVAQTTPADGGSRRSRDLPLALGARPHPVLTASLSTAAADRTIAALRWTSLLLGLFGLALAVLLGSFWSRQVSRPVERLADFSQRVARGEWDEPLALDSVRELESLVGALESMRSDLAAYRARLLASERQAAWSEMARQVAHEIKNPLTPIAVSIADLRRSYDAQRPDFPEILDQAVRTVAAEVETMKRLLQEFSDFGRFPAPRLEPVRIGALLDELETLHGHEVQAGRLAFRREGDPVVAADAGQLKQALGNLIRNGLDALDGTGTRVTVEALGRGDALRLSVTDDGPGFDADQERRLFVPGYTTKAHGSGLGLTIVERIVVEHGGTIAVDSAPGAGATFRITLPLTPRT